VFKLLRTDDADLTRVQQNVQTAFNALSTAGSPTVQKVTSSLLLPDSTDILYVNTQTGKVTVTLPSSRTKQVVIIHGFGGNELVINGNVSPGSANILPARYSATLMPIDGTYYYISRYPVA